MTTKTEVREAKEFLREYIEPGDTIYTILRHVSRSGMYRAIDLFVIEDKKPFCISHWAAKLLEGYDRRHEACRASGVGMDMGFHLVYNLGARLFPNGFTCAGKECPSNDHSNKPYPSRDGMMLHESGGYALNHRWL